RTQPHHPSPPESRPTTRRLPVSCSSPTSLFPDSILRCASLPLSRSSIRNLIRRMGMWCVVIDGGVGRRRRRGTGTRSRGGRGGRRRSLVATEEERQSQTHKIEQAAKDLVVKAIGQIDGRQRQRQ